MNNRKSKPLAVAFWFCFSLRHSTVLSFSASRSDFYWQRSRQDRTFKRRNSEDFTKAPYSELNFYTWGKEAAAEEASTTRPTKTESVRTAKLPPAEQIKPNIFQKLFQNTTQLEMGGMAAAGLALSIGVVVTLAMSDPGQPLSPMDTFQDSPLEDLFAGSESNLEELKVITGNVLDAALPTSASDAVAAALGEGIAGTLGAVVTAFVKLGLQLRMSTIAKSPEDISAGKDGGTESAEGLNSNFLSSAVADGDYFFTRAAALPLLEAIGVPEGFAAVASVLVATIPYEVLKMNTQMQRSRKEEAAMMNELLEKKLRDEDRGKGIQALFSKRIQERDPIIEPASEEISSIRKYESLDVVSLFTDVTKWLEFEVLRNDFLGKIRYQGQIIPSGIESALFGFVAAFSSQLYADLLYKYSNFGSEENTEESRTRTFFGWVSLYSTKCLSAAALFGIYEVARYPISRALQGILTGGMDSCIGSSDFDVCMETYEFDNPPVASYEGQVRALVAAVSSLADRFQTDANAAETFRALIVALYSLWNRIISSPLDFVLT